MAFPISARLLPLRPRRPTSTRCARASNTAPPTAEARARSLSTRSTKRRIHREFPPRGSRIPESCLFRSSPAAGFQATPRSDESATKLSGVQLVIGGALGVDTFSDGRGPKSTCCLLVALLQYAACAIRPAAFCLRRTVRITGAFASSHYIRSSVRSYRGYRPATCSNKATVPVGTVQTTKLPHPITVSAQVRPMQTTPAQAGRE